MKTENFSKICSFFLFTLCPVFLLAAPSRDPLKEFPSRVKKITLQNGARVLMVERSSSPTVSFSVYIRSGGLDDELGKSGLAHMFEHMLFKGTRTIGTKNYRKEAPLLKEIDTIAVQLDKAGDIEAEGQDQVKADLEARLRALQEKHEDLIVAEEFWKIYEQAGGEGLNAGTAFDYTNYVVSLPRNQVKLWVAMEVDRLKNPVLREFYKERDVVMEELRGRVDNSPRGKLWQAFLAAAFMVHPYGRPLIGWKHEVARLTVDDAETFFKKHYDISRFIFVIVGGIDADEVGKMMKKSFGTIPSRHPPAPRPLPVEPSQDGERRVEVLYDAEPSLLIGYHRPNFRHPDNAALEVLSDVLSSGRTSRFYKNIVQKNQIGISAWASSSTPGERDACLFGFGGRPRAPHTTADLEEAIYKEIERIKKDGPTEKEVEKVKNFTFDYVIRSLSSNAGLARHLGYYEAVAGDWQHLFRLIEDIQKVTREDVRRVAQKYLIKSNRTVAVLVKKGKD